MQVPRNYGSTVPWSESEEERAHLRLRRLSFVGRVPTLGIGLVVIVAVEYVAFPLRPPAFVPACPRACSLARHPPLAVHLAYLFPPARLPAHSLHSRAPASLLIIVSTHSLTVQLTACPFDRLLTLSPATRSLTALAYGVVALKHS